MQAGSLRDLRPRAGGALGEAIGLQAQCDVDARTVVLPRNHVGQLEQPLLAEPLPHRCDQLVVDLRRRQRHPCREGDDQQLVRVEQAALLRLVQVVELVVGDAVLSGDV